MNPEAQNTPDATPTPTPPQWSAGGPQSTHVSKKLIAICVAAAVIVAAGIGFGAWQLGKHSTPTKTATNTVDKTGTKPTDDSTAATIQGLQLDTAKNYGNKYTNGLLPVGDSKYDTSSAKSGVVYVCSAYAQNFGRDKGGAGSRGPWFTNNNTQYDINKKAHIQGSVTWQADFTMHNTSDTRTIVTNGLPSHPTGTFPVAASDPAYAYDRNPNTIKGQTLTYSLPLAPTYGTPNCMGGEAGIMLTGIPLFNAFDAGGRDAGAWEVQDGCSGHPQVSGEYHYHTLSSCIKDTGVSTVIGYALDGFPITGPKVGSNNVLTTADLDECHGLTSKITVDNKTVTSYHYVMTEDFPYSVSCFRSQATQPPGKP
ncbi:MAG TPA: YHYH protein [Patescibacteria group bacterium]|nr:YHYH protein [Patescibacteria group bacterium]